MVVDDGQGEGRVVGVHMVDVDPGDTDQRGHLLHITLTTHLKKSLIQAHCDNLKQSVLITVDN